MAPTFPVTTDTNPNAIPIQDNNTTPRCSK